MDIGLQEDGDNNLFASVKRPNTALDATVKDCVARYERGPEPAMVDLLNFIFQSCGALKNYVPDSQRLEDLEIEDVMEIRGDLSWAAFIAYSPCLLPLLYSTPAYLCESSITEYFVNSLVNAKFTFCKASR